MSDSVQPHAWQPTRLPRPWDSPGTNSGVGCHFLLQCMQMKSESEVALSCPTPSDPMDCSLPGSTIHGIFQARVLEWGAIAFSLLLLVCRYARDHCIYILYLATLLNSLMSSSSFLVAFSGLSRWLSGKESSCQCRRLEM